MKFRKKPVEVDAFQVTQKYLDSFRDDKEFEPKRDEDGAVSYCEEYVNRDNYPLTFYIRKGDVVMVIHTLEGTMRASVGDWIVTGVDGEKYPCKPDIFEKTYEPVLNGVKFDEVIYDDVDNPAWANIRLVGESRKHFGMRSSRGQ